MLKVLLGIADALGAVETVKTVKDSIQKKNKKDDIGKKYDDGKPKWHLLPIDEMTDVVKVLTFGANKYGDDNWKNVKPITRYTDATFRHLGAFVNGEWLDQESKLPHLAHAISNILFMMWHYKKEGRA
jgi:hypothetical protein